MKTLKLIFFVILSSIWGLSFAQQATGGCNSITVTDDPFFETTLYNIQPVGNDCFVFASGVPAKVRYYLQKKDHNTGTYSYVGGLQYGDYQYDRNFNNVDKGTYRIRFEIPIVRDNFACIGGKVDVLNILQQWIGHIGTFVGSPDIFSEDVYVGATTAKDISFTFVDPGETGSEQAYDFGEHVKIDVSASKDYNLWWLAVSESGHNNNRYYGNGWTHGRIEEFDLTEFWTSRGWNFNTWHTYNVTFVTENRQCRNGIEHPGTSWNDLTRGFLVCPAGSGCRFSVGNNDVNMNIQISPNPANSFIKLNNFTPDLHSQYQLIIVDMAGRTVKNTPLNTERIDITGLSKGMFMVHVRKEGQEIFNSKLLVN